VMVSMWACLVVICIFVQIVTILKTTVREHRLKQMFPPNIVHVVDTE
jgi:hypothetical protein